MHILFHFDTRLRKNVWGVLLVLGLFCFLPASGCPAVPPASEPVVDAGEGKEQEPHIPEEPLQIPEARKESKPDTVVALPLDKALAKEETRAGKITRESERITGPEASSRVGDWKIYNERVAFVIHGLQPSRSFSGGRGHLIDASVVDAQGNATRDMLEEVFSGFGLFRVVQATEIKVIEPGGKGKRALIRVTSAVDGGIPILDEVLTSRPFDGKIEVDYILSPGASHLTIVTRLLGGDRLADQRMGDGLLLGDQTRLIASGVGWNTKDSVGKEVLWFGAIGSVASYLLTPATTKAPLQIPITQAAIYPAFGAIAAADESKSEYTRHFFVGDGRLEPLLDGRRALLKLSAPARTIKGKVSGPVDLSLVQIELRDDKGVTVSVTRPGDDGSFQFVAADGTYECVAFAKGHKESKQAVSVGKDVSLSFAAGASLALTIKEKQLDGTVGGFVPVHVSFQGSPSFRVNVTAPDQVIPVPPGTYTVTVSRGLAYEYWQKKLDFTPSGQQPAALKEEVVLERVIDTSGYVTGDMHLHASPSIDSEFALEGRVGALVAEGVQFAVATDHDRFTDYSPVVQKLGVGNWLTTAIGQEVSPLAFHFNIFPLATVPADEPRYFGLGWALYEDRTFQKVLSAPEIWAKARKSYGVDIIQINHPRTNQAFLNKINYDRTKGVGTLKAGLFDTNWDTIEIYNGGDRTQFLSNIQDWFSFVNQGLYKTAVGNSDSHSAGSRPGMPCTLIATKTPQGNRLTPQEAAAQLKANRAIIYAGPMIRATIDKKEAPGGRFQGPEHIMSVTISAPSWVPVAYVKVYANGELWKKWDVPASTDRIRWKQDITLKPAKDTWYVVIAGDDDKAMSVVYSQKPISMTNAIFVDIDGKGFTAPGLPPAP